jgi:hypothetical protein
LVFGVSMKWQWCLSGLLPVVGELSNLAQVEAEPADKRTRKQN